MQTNVIGEPRWDVPAGIYRATLKKVSSVPSNQNVPVLDMARLCFNVHHPRFKKRDYWAGRNFKACLQLDCELRDVVRCLRGGVDLTDEEIETGKLNLEAYIGKQVDLELVHIKNSRYRKPYIFIRGIYATGTLVKDCEVVPISQPVNAEQIHGLN